MEFLPSQVLALIAWITPLTLAVVQVFKNANVVSSRWAGFASIFFGIGLAFLFGNFTFWVNIGAGLVAGLSAAGVYSSFKSAGVSSSSTNLSDQA